MISDNHSGTPQSPEVHDEEVRDELDQDQVTHQGDWRGPVSGLRPKDQHGMHLGANDDEVVPIVPPMSGPADLLGQEDTNAQGNEDGDTEIGEELIDPRDHLTPG